MKEVVLLSLQSFEEVVSFSLKKLAFFCQYATILVTGS
jgi:hypothetical protein